MTPEQKIFCENVTILLSPQEKTSYITHITDNFNKWNIKYKKTYAPEDLKEGDYTFCIFGKDYRQEFLVERKFGLEEIYAGLTSENKKTKAKSLLAEKMEGLGITGIRDNLEAEFGRMLVKGIDEKWLFIENCESFESILDYKNGMEKRNQTAGELIYSTLMSWSCQNRYGFKVCCVSNKNDFASILIKKMFYYWRNYMIKTYGKGFIKIIKSEEGKKNGY